MLKIETAIKQGIGLLLAASFLIGVAGVASATIRFEHVALNVQNPKEVADWYVKYVGLKIVSANKKMIFVGDPGGHCMFELYNKAEAKGKYSDLNHAAAHIAFATDDVKGLTAKLVKAGAKQLKETKNPAGDIIIDMLDPWGNMIQFAQRVKPKL
jgi:catechol-2,3-dioxygenase